MKYLGGTILAAFIAVSLFGCPQAAVVVAPAACIVGDALKGWSLAAIAADCKVSVEQAIIAIISDLTTTNTPAFKESTKLRMTLSKFDGGAP